MLHDSRTVVHTGAVVRRALKSWRSWPLRAAQASIHALGSAPEPVLRMAFGSPPRSDRGHALDRSTHALLRLLALSGRGHLHELEPTLARTLARRDGALVDWPASEPVEQRELELDGAAGPLRARAYTPAGLRSAPILVWLHGGGFVIGGLETHRNTCARLAARARCVVVAVDYRKAPEHRFPAAVDDSLASFRWIRAHAEQLGGQPDRVAIGGDSAGGNLSAVVCHRLREAGEAQPSLQVLIYPSTHTEHPFESYRRFSEGALLTADMLRWFADHYLRGPEDRRNPDASPLLASNFEGLAPALIRTAGFDPLRDEGEAYAQALAAAGVEVDHRCYEGLIHNYLVMTAIPANRAAVDELGDELVRALRRPLGDA
jgi:acetyl esterase